MAAARVRSLGGGMNSQTWWVEHDGATFVAKSVPASGLPDLIAGAEVAAALADAGFVTGRPVPAREGMLVLTDPALVLLQHVPGRELDGGTAEEQGWMADTLAGIHTAGNPAVGDPALGPGTAAFAPDWLSPHAPGVADHPWLTAAIDAVRAETDPLTVTWSVLHTDPFPGAFIHDDRTGTTGLVDWAGARRGPVLYDVASAVMYLGGTDRAAAFLRRYSARGPLTAHELQHLDAFRRFRAAVQGVYFAGRLATNDLTGGIDTTENEKGLADARRLLATL
ncbi:phosphotransferase enzyme family protein [Kineosporia sp. A_224]|uniref:phosphotransferase enzyme family protein n=1 Tax=Kineosporia sp. A_224 TaxID=1962180 RepID=UPI000B4BF3AE|nr:phosphotransferase [Kineosporia sp. A_224]